MGSKKCEVCNDAHSKYKCPSCLTPYCSLVCYKKHKEIHSEKTESSLNLKPNEDSVFTTPPAATTSAAAAATTALEKEASDPLLLAAAAAAAAAAVERPPPLLVHKPGDILQQSQLQTIASCSEIREALINDQTLQKIIHQIDSSSQPEIELTNAMDEVEAFYKFTEKIQSIITPR